MGTGRAVALKVLHGPGRGEPSRRESALQRRIDHPHLLTLLRTTRTTDGRTALVTELAAGGSLAALVRARGGLDPGEVVTVLTPLAGALADLHDRGVVHGDVSAGNVLFLADGRPVLADLGTAGLLGVDPATHATPGYADPAVARGAGLAPASDVHALGALAWFALTASVAGAGRAASAAHPGGARHAARARLAGRALPRPRAAPASRCRRGRGPGVPGRRRRAGAAGAHRPVGRRRRGGHAPAAGGGGRATRVPPVVRTPRRRRRPVVVAAAGALLVALGVAATTLDRPSGASADLAGSARTSPAATTRTRDRPRGRGRGRQPALAGAGEHHDAHADLHAVDPGRPARRRRPAGWRCRH